MSPLCRSRRELSIEYLLAKFGFDTAENEPAKNLQNLIKSCKISYNLPILLTRPAGRVEAALRGRARRAPPLPVVVVVALRAELGGRTARSRRRPIGKISAKCCSFSAVSAPIFESKYVFSACFEMYKMIQKEKKQDDTAEFCNFPLL